ncbi:MAG: helix-turn-helix domain-containing protein [Treponema sp.]|nr:helix-turn-helix domain-containing protein [Treponema sp.]
MREKISPILNRTLALQSEYAQATGAHVCILDQNYLPVVELLDKMLSEKNPCIFCLKYKKNLEAKRLRDLSANPCREVHINAVRNSQRFGGSYTYQCDLGFVFWTSPIYLNGQFAGAVFGGGFLGIERNEALDRLRNVCGGALSDAELSRRLSHFPKEKAHKIKALAEIMLICAQSVSVGSEDSHPAMKRRLDQQSDISARIEELKNHYPQGGPKPEYPMDKEQALLETLRKGKTESGRHILNDILAVLYHANPNQFKHVQYRAIELAVLLSRLDSSPGFSTQTSLKAANRHIKAIRESNTIEEITDALHRILDDLAGQILSFQGIQHPSALKKAEQYILENFTRKISLEEIAKKSGFSSPYFSTMFKEEMGENLSSYLNRLRVEKAKALLTDTVLPLSKIARSSGFEDQSWFSKIFKSFTGISPGKYRNQGQRLVSAIPAKSVPSYSML